MASKIWFRPKTPDVKRILIHAINHVGLGHINRSIAVAQWLQASVPNLQVLFLLEGGEDFLAPTGYPWVLIPGQAAESEHCEQMVRTVLSVFQPDVMIHETILRDKIHRPVREAGVKQVIMGNVGGALRDQFEEYLPLTNEVNLVIILQQQEEVVAADQALIARYQGKTLYAGPLVRKKSQAVGDELRQRLGLSRQDKVILATFGGGGWDIARALLTNIVNAKAQILAQYPQARLIVITGPHFSGPLPQPDEFVRYASRFEPFLTDYINIASVVVTMAGYSTVNEVAGTGIPAICIPAPEAEDQIGVGSMSDYAQTFANFVLSSEDKDEITRKVIAALGKERDLSVVAAYWQRAENASQRIVHEIKALLHVQ